MPSDADISRVREYTVDKMKEMLADPYLHWTSHEFVRLRDLADCRITLFNARRGGEPARLTMSNWTDAKNDVWLNQERIRSMPEPDRSTFRDMKVMYQTGKGNHLVPFLVPADTMAALDKLCDPNTRSDCSVLSSNVYLFPSTNNSAEHVYGWLAVQKVSQAAEIDRPDLVTATRMRHRVSTLYAALDVPPSQRSNFYRHMGHSAQINESIYQAPLAEVEISQVGRVLQDIETRGTDTADNQLGGSGTTSRCATSSRARSENETDAATSQSIAPAAESGSVENVEVPVADTATSAVPLTSTANSRNETQRQYTRWSDVDAQRVTSYFKLYITGQKAGHPGKAEIQQFVNRFKFNKYGLSTIRNKIVNEKAAYTKRQKDRMRMLADN